MSVRLHIFTKNKRTMFTKSVLYISVLHSFNLTVQNLNLPESCSFSFWLVRKCCCCYEAKEVWRTVMKCCFSHFVSSREIKPPLFNNIKSWKFPRTQLKTSHTGEINSLRFPSHAPPPAGALPCCRSAE